MTVQELFKSLNPDSFVREYFLYDSTGMDAVYASDNISEAVSKLKSCIGAAFDRFCTSECVLSDDIVFGLSLGEIYSSPVDVFLVKRSELETYQGNKEEERLETYAFEFEEPSAILGYQVSEACLHVLGDMRFACAIFEEMTFFGFDEEESKASKQDIMDSVDASMEEIEAGHTKSLKEVLANLGIVDKRKPFEKELDDALLLLECKYSDLIRRHLFMTEKQYWTKGDNV